MYCSHCGKKINENALEKKQSSYVIKDENNELVPVDTDQKVEYVCPRCGHLIHEDLNDEEMKSLSRAAHSQLQRGANSFAFGMAFNLIGIIIGILAFSFYLLSFVSSGGKKVLDTSKSTFLVFVVMGIMAVILLGFGIYNTIVGISKKTAYTKLLKDLNNKTFVQ
jgi:DNA-directed RNA polymerase subunit RPC12/RpoP